MWKTCALNCWKTVIDALLRGQELSYYHRNEQFSTTFITDRYGEIPNSYQYDVFGVQLEAAENFQNCIRYMGQQYDELAEQYYLRARYYIRFWGVLCRRMSTKEID